MAMIRRPSVRPSSIISKIFFSETAVPIKLKFYVEPPWVVALKYCSRYLGHMTKMASMPIYGKSLQKSSPEPASRFPRNLVCSILHVGLQPIIVCSNEITGPMKVKFYVEPPCEGGTKVCTQNVGQKLNMAAMLTNDQKCSKIFFSRTGGPIFTKPGM